MVDDLPTVATNVNAILDLVGDGINGLLVESEDVDDLMNPHRYLRDDHRERDKMGVTGSNGMLIDSIEPPSIRKFDREWLRMYIGPRCTVGYKSWIKQHITASFVCTMIITGRPANN